MKAFRLIPAVLLLCACDMDSLPPAPPPATTHAATAERLLTPSGIPDVYAVTDPRRGNVCSVVHLGNAGGITCVPDKTPSVEGK